MKYIKLTVLAVFVLVPLSNTWAYVTTDQHAFLVTGKSAIYAIEFEFGHGDHEVHIPVLARDTMQTSRDFISYTLQNDEGEQVSNVQSAGIVLGNAPIEDGVYKVPKGEKRAFTLLVIASATAEMKTTDMYTQVQYLPFSFDGEEPLQLNPSELQYYKTPSVTLPLVARVQKITIVPAS